VRAFSRLFVFALLLLIGSTALAATKAPRSSSAPLGSPDFKPTPEQPVGWRGDGTGRYPGATPPTSWSRKRSGAGYATKGILWMTPLPNISVSSPIIVGKRIFVTTEVSDLVCLDKQSGRILWIRSNPEFEGLSAAERKANPAYAQLAALLPLLAKANGEAVATLNALQPTAAASPARPLPVLQMKRELDKKIQEAQLSIDKKKFDRNWAQAMFGFSGPTPSSDGEFVYVYFTTGVVACYDLNGKRQWINRGGTGMSEHGNFASPLLCGNRFVIWAAEMRGYDVATGKLAWTNPGEAGNTYGSLFRLRAGKDLVAGFQAGYFTRTSDGQAIWGKRVFGDCVSTPIVEKGFVFAWVGYPRNSEKLGFKAFPIPPVATGPWPKAAWTFADWSGEGMNGKFDRSYTASPLYVNGLIYQLSEGGGLSVHDAATGATVYCKALPMKPKTEYWGWAGASASPTLAGKYIYLMDNQGTTIVISPGKQYKAVAQNLLEESGDGKSQAQNLATPVFEAARMYYRTPGYLYCIGTQ
jgi:outer membrane protein assembly factor BamB